MALVLNEHFKENLIPIQEMLRKKEWRFEIKAKADEIKFEFLTVGSRITITNYYVFKALIEELPKEILRT